MATLLSTITTVCERLGQPVPATVMGNTDKQVVQMRALLEEGLDALSDRAAWERLVNQATHTTLATEDQGAIATICANGFRYIINDTFWDRDSKLPVCGSVSPQDWQLIKAMVVNGPRYQFRLRGGNLLVNPVPTAGLNWACEYVSENTILAADLTTYKKRFTADTDTILLPDQVVQLDLRWRWKKEKGLPYAEDFNAVEALIANATARDGGNPTLQMDVPNRDVIPGIFVTPGSWPL